ncbi:MAG TPA: undecaprenyl-diphosphate phosphatase, partial [Fimbriimonas sp.]|nr:undecaprenyl-diphosphate phosphatase [Fimbriimonas sp.]
VDLLTAIIMGIVQGATEFLPISSTAHLRIVPELLGKPDPGAAFTAVIQLGTVAAVLIYFGKDLWKALRGWGLSLVGKEDKNSVDARMGWGVFWGTFPIMIFGFAFKHQIKSDEMRSLYVIAWALIVMGILMLVAERVGKKDKPMNSATVRDGIVIGLWQCLALVPGVSRSGSTITGALFSGFDRPTAARYSFLLSVPAITIAGLYELWDERHNILGPSLMPAIVATLVSFVVGYAAIAFLIKYLQKHGIAVFVLYRFLLAALLLVMLSTGGLKAQSEKDDSNAHTMAQPS